MVPEVIVSGLKTRLPCEIETVGHVVRLGIVLVQVWQPELRLTKFEQTHMRVERFRDVPTFGIGAEHETADARPVAELRAIPGWMVPVSFGMTGIMLPPFDIRRIHMVEPAAPIVPSNKNRRRGPQPALHDGVDLF